MSAGKCWEYKVIAPAIVGENLNMGTMDQVLDYYGARNWELVTITDDLATVVFKRPTRDE